VATHRLCAALFSCCSPTFSLRMSMERENAFSARRGGDDIAFRSGRSRRRLRGRRLTAVTPAEIRLSSSAPTFAWRTLRVRPVKRAVLSRLPVHHWLPLPVLLPLPAKVSDRSANPVPLGSATAVTTCVSNVLFAGRHAPCGACVLLSCSLLCLLFQPGRMRVAAPALLPSPCCSSLCSRTNNMSRTWVCVVCRRNCGLTPDRHMLAAG